MKELTPHEIQKARMIKAAKAAIRLKHALACDEEIYKTIPRLAGKIDKALLSGKKLELKDVFPVAS